MNKLIVILSLSTIVLFSCKKEQQPAKTQAEFIAELESSPDTIGIGNNVFDLDPYIVRNFMPVCEENGDPLYCAVLLKDVNNGNQQEITTLKRIYLIRGNELWSSKEYTKSNTGWPNIISGVFYGGPKWEPNSQVDVVCEFNCQGVTKRIIAKAQNVNAVY